MDTKQQVIRQMQAIGQKVYEIGMMKRENYRTLHQSDIRTVVEMVDHLYRYKPKNGNLHKENIYIRALPDEIHNVIFLDDLTPDALNYMKEKGVLPAAVVHTSTKSGIASLHAWYKLPQNMDRATRKAVEYILLTELHAAFPDDPQPGDFGSNDGGHYGRLAGFQNHGLTSPRDCPVILTEATGHTLSHDVGQQLLEKAAPFIDYEPTPNTFEPLNEIWERPYENPKIVHYFKENVLPKIDYSRPPYQQDFFLVCYLLRKQFSPADVKKVLLELTPHPIHEGRKRNPPYYLWLTMKDAAEAIEANPHDYQPRISPHSAPGLGYGGAHVLLPFAGAGATAPAPGSQPTEHTATPKRPPRRIPMGVKPRNLGSNRSDLGRAYES